MRTVKIDKSQLESKGISLRCGRLQFRTEVKQSDTTLLAFIEKQIQHVNEQNQIHPYKDHPHLMATRYAYKSLGKDPSRYRPSSDALLRRILSKKGLYQINNVVDLLNICSVNSQFSIGGYDLDHIQGQIEVVVGGTQHYDAIGRGPLNVQDLPMLQDDVGLFGSPTSDSQRTSIQLGERNCLFVVFDFGLSNQLTDFLSQTAQHLATYCHAHQISTSIS